MTGSLLRVLLLAHAGATLFMVGVIWFVQVVHYPLFGLAGTEEFPAYEQANTRRTLRVVAPVMLVEAASALLLVWVRPAGVSMTQVVAGLVLLLVIWLSTFVLQVPAHDQLTRAYSPAVHATLVQTNWIRTATWSLRGVVVLWMVWSAARGWR